MRISKKTDASSDRVSKSLSKSKTKATGSKTRKAITQVTSPTATVKPRVTSTITSNRSVAKQTSAKLKNSITKKPALVQSPSRNVRSTRTLLHKRAESSHVARFDDVRSHSYVVPPSVNNVRVQSLATENMELQRRLNERSPSLHSRRGSLTSLSCNARGTTCDNFTIATAFNKEGSIEVIKELR
jgi:hypothetical protein